LDRLIGPVSEVELTEPITVGALLARLRDREPRLERFVWVNPAGAQVWGLMVLKNDRILKPTDCIAPGDQLEVMVMAEGG